jgi:hypothetical protein
MSYDTDRRCKLARGLKAARRNVNLSAAVAARLISAKGVKCTRGTLLSWERGHGLTSREPFASDLPIFAGIYECDVNALFGQSEAADATDQLLQPNAEAELATNS